MRSVGTALLAGLLVLTGCENVEEDWQSAREADTVAAYNEFLFDHPNSDFAAQAQERIETLKREAAYREAAAAGTIEALTDFLRDYPDAPQAGEIRAEIDRLEREAVWRTLADSQDAEALQDFIEQYAGTSEADAAQARLTLLQEREAGSTTEPEAVAVPAVEPGDHVVQLAAFRDPDSATKAADEFSSRYAEVLTGVDLQVDAATGGQRFSRVQTEAMSKAMANELCEQLKSRGQDCLVMRQ